jgi:hypothetical protein
MPPRRDKQSARPRADARPVTKPSSDPAPAGTGETPAPPQAAPEVARMAARLPDVSAPAAPPRSRSESGADWLVTPFALALMTLLAPVGWLLGRRGRS